ncbi:hypothetical protein ACFYRY_06410 [Streptomyces sp. NPDC005263]|uniref:hypothetical protein n=1 Tax=Streptomyces sp. NPDC005263 TaxID=3364711 RepID=UPI0036CB4C10
MDRGLLARHDHPSNRRTVQLTITEAGAKLADLAREVVERLDGEAMVALAPAERAVIHSLLLRVLAELNPDALLRECAA